MNDATSIDKLYNSEFHPYGKYMLLARKSTVYQTHGTVVYNKHKIQHRGDAHALVWVTIVWTKGWEVPADLTVTEAVLCHVHMRWEGQ